MAKEVITQNLITKIPAGADLSIMHLVSNADGVVKTVLLILFLCSIICWGIIFEKAIRLKVLRLSTQKFEKIFWSGQLLDDIYKRVKNKVNHPMAAVFVSAMQEWDRSHDESNNLYNPEETTLRAGIKERIIKAMQVAQNRSLDKLEKNLTFLATVSSSAPFIGLFGTVWGIMHSFQSIAASKNTSLAVVAPGIAEALFATAIGLFAAIPAVIAYNIYNDKLNKYMTKLEDFSNELTALLFRELDSKGD